MRLASGKGVTYRSSFQYQGEEFFRHIEVWKNDNRFVLTWEEYKHALKFDEESYMKDEVETFDSVESVVSYITSNGICIEDFTP